MNAFFSGSPEIRENVSLLRKGQEPLYNQLIKAGMKRGAGGAFGSAADYYRDLLEGQDDESQFKAFADPLMRQYREDLVPSLSEQFAGMGAGGLSSSGFRNAQVQGATDLSERLAQIKANLQQFRSGLRQNAAQGLMNLGSQGLQSYSQNMVTQPGSQGFLSNIAPAIGTGIGAYFGGPAGAAAGNAIGQGVSGNFMGNKTGPYGQGGPVASPQSMPPYMNAMQGWR